MDRLCWIRHYKLRSFYLSLSPQEKEAWLKAQEEQHYTPFSPSLPHSTAEFLWTSAVSLQRGSLDPLAEKLLLKAIDVAELPIDRAQAHANLARLYHDWAEKEPWRLIESDQHLRAVIDSGYFTSWAHYMLEAHAATFNTPPQATPEKSQT